MSIIKSDPICLPAYYGDMVNLHKVLTTMLLIAAILCSGSFAASPEDGIKRNGDHVKERHRFKKNDNYKTFSSGPFLIKIKVRDVSSGELHTLVLPNNDFAVYYAFDRGYGYGESAEDREQREIIFKEYRKFIIRRENEIIDLDLNRFRSFIEKHYRQGDTFAEEYVSDALVKKKLSFNDLHIKDRAELKLKYLDFDSTRGAGKLKKEYFEGPLYSSDLISFLMDLGFLVRYGHYYPGLYVYELSE